MIFSGFDTSAYPSDAVMKKWKAASPYSFCGYYIQSPCHGKSGWTGKRGVLVDMGWKLLPVYVGQQPAGASRCRKNVLTAEQGKADGVDAAKRMEKEGFAEASYVYLDIEHIDVFPASMGTYVSEWSAAVARNGYSPAVYCHKQNAAEIRAAVAAGGGAAPPRFWIAGGSADHFNIETSKPADSGIAFADLWQCPEPVSRTFGGQTILIDEDVSTLADPAAAIPT